MAKKFLPLMLSLLTLVIAVSCSNDDDVAQLSTLTIQLTSENPIDDYSSFQLNITDLKSGSVTTAEVNAAGTAVVTLPLGSYNISAENPVDGASSM